MAKASFTGNVSHTIDPKGRVTIPNAYRPALGDMFTIGLNNQFNALALYPKERWEAIEEDLDRIPLTDAKGMQYVRLISGNSFADCRLDGQGRVLLPQSLRQKARLDKDIRFVGVGKCLEIWDEERYRKESGEAEGDVNELLAYVNDRYFGSQV